MIEKHWKLGLVVLPNPQLMKPLSLCMGHVFEFKKNMVIDKWDRPPFEKS